MRPLLLPGLLDAARHNTAHGAGELALFESAHIYIPGEGLDRARGQPGGRRARHRAPPPGRPAHHRRAWQLAPRAGARRTSTPPRATSRRCSGPRASSSAWGRARGPSCTPAARRLRAAATGARQAGSGSCTRSSRGRGISRGPQRSSWTSICWPRRPAATWRIADVTAFPAVLQDIAVVVASDVSAARGGRHRARGRGRSARPRRGVRRVRGRAGGGGQPVAGAAAGVPRPRPHAHRRGGRRARGLRSRPRWARSGGSSVPRVAVIGAAGFGGALCAGIVQRHPSLELTVVTARSDAGRRHDELYPIHRVELTMGEFDADVDRRAGGRRPGRPTRTRPPPSP